MTVVYESDTIRVDDNIEGRVVYFRKNPYMIQGGMKWDRLPAAAPCEYLEKMIDTIWQVRPREILVLGLGGGTLVKAALLAMPTARITVIEKDKSIIDAAIRYFDVPPRHPRVRMIHADAYYQLKEFSTKSFNLILCDIADDQGSIESFFRADVNRYFKKLLIPGGMLCMNFYKYKQTAVLEGDTYAHWRHVETENLSSGNQIFRFYA